MAYRTPKMEQARGKDTLLTTLQTAEAMLWAALAVTLASGITALIHWQ